MAPWFPNSLAIPIDFPSSTNSYERRMSSRRHGLASDRAAMKGKNRFGCLHHIMWPVWRRVPRPPAGNSYISAHLKRTIIIIMPRTNMTRELQRRKTRQPTRCKRALTTWNGTRLSTDSRVGATSLPKLLPPMLQIISQINSSSNCSNSSRWDIPLLVS